MRALSRKRHTMKMPADGTMFYIDAQITGIFLLLEQSIYMLCLHKVHVHSLQETRRSIRRATRIAKRTSCPPCPAA